MELSKIVSINVISPFSHAIANGVLFFESRHLIAVIFALSNILIFSSLFNYVAMCNGVYYLSFLLRRSAPFEIKYSSGAEDRLIAAMWMRWYPFLSVYFILLYCSNSVANTLLDLFKQAKCNGVSLLKWAFYIISSVWYFSSS